jgi:hypothetical protein
VVAGREYRFPGICYLDPLRGRRAGGDIDRTAGDEDGRRQVAPEEDEDKVLDVMDFLTGLCSNHTKI